MIEKPELSIVIISYNTQDMTRECLESVYANASGLDLEIIVVDDASRDGSVEMIEQCFPAALLIKNTENRGFAAANNQAFAVARGDFILLLNSDTIILGDALQRSLEYLRRNPEAGAMACRALNTDRTVQLTCSEYPSHLNLLLMTTGLDRLPWPKALAKYQMRHWQRDSERDVEVISGCFLLIRRPAFEQVGLLDEGFFLLRRGNRLVPSPSRSRLETPVRAGRAIHTSRRRQRQEAALQARPHAVRGDDTPAREARRPRRGSPDISDPVAVQRDARGFLDACLTPRHQICRARPPFPGRWFSECPPPGARSRCAFYL